MQDTNERHGSGVAVWFFRTLLLLAAAVVMTVALVPGAQAAESQNSAPRSVIPLGRAVGIKLFAQGVLVVGLSDITTDQGLASPARACGLQEGDVITHINDAQVSSIEEVQTILQDLEGQEMELTVLRDEESQEVTTRAAQCSTDGAYKLGAWIRDSMAGIGTLTFVDPETGLFGTLGHGINDVDTAVLMKLQSGAITPASVAGVVKGVNGGPGNSGGPSPPARTWAPYTPTRRAACSATFRTPARSRAPLCLWPQRRRSTPDRPPSWPMWPARRWRSTRWKFSKSTPTPRTPGT